MNELDELIKKFRPKFGDPESIRISQKYAKILRMRQSAEQKKRAAADALRSEKRATQAEKDLVREEANLVEALKPLVDKEFAALAKEQEIIQKNQS